MASLEHDKTSGRFRIRFRFGGEEYKRSLKVTSEKEADGLRARVEETILLLERGRMEMPEGADPAEFILSDGKRGQKPAAPERVLTLDELISTYKAEFTTGAKEKNTQKTEGIHFGHLKRLIGSKTPVTKITSAAVQRYVDARAKERHAGREVRTQTIRKEVGSLQSVFSWAAHREIIPATFSTRRVVFPKSKDKPPFQTYEEISAIVKRGGLSSQAERELWDNLFLTTEQVSEALIYVRENATVEWLYPLVVAAAHTGARRSELLRSRIEDFNFEAKTVLLREKKKSKERETFRVVDMTPFLSGVVKAYFASGHPGGAVAFAAEANVELTDGVSQKVFRRLLNKSTWKVLRGYHVFRHSFASNLARAGIDQRVVDELMGHQTEAMRRRYRHLFPAERRKAIEAVFGGSPSGIVGTDSRAS